MREFKHWFKVFLTWGKEYHELRTHHIVTTTHPLIILGDVRLIETYYFHQSNIKTFNKYMLLPKVSLPFVQWKLLMTKRSHFLISLLGRDIRDMVTHALNLANMLISCLIPVLEVLVLFGGKELSSFNLIIDKWYSLDNSKKCYFHLQKKKSVANLDNSM